MSIKFKHKRNRFIHPDTVAVMIVVGVIISGLIVAIATA